MSSILVPTTHTDKGNYMEKDLRQQIKDTILREGVITAGNLNDYANLAVRISATDDTKLQEFFDTELEEGQKYKVIISTDKDVNADCSFKDEKGFYAHFYKK